MIPSKEELESKYFARGGSVSSISREYNTSRPTVRKWLKLHGIESKPKGQVISEVAKEIPMPDKEELENLYHSMSLASLRKHYGIGQEKLYEWLKLSGIELKSLSDATKRAKSKKYESIRFPKDTLETLLEENAHDKSAVASSLGVSYSHIKKLSREYGIPHKQTDYKSKAEIELLEFCKSIRPDMEWQSGNRKAISPYEIDIYCEDLKFGIEYCGLYWHSENAAGKSKKYHSVKRDRCEDIGIDLIHVFETDDAEKVKNLIRKKIDKNQPRIFARKTELFYPTKQEEKDFHDRYHLHNSVGSSFSLGLKYRGETVMILSMGRSRFSDKYEWECTRLSSNKNVIGGASKLFKAFIREKSPESIVTFSDLRFGTGKVYEHCGFRRAENTPPNYWYFKVKSPTSLMSRVAFQKHRLPGILSDFDESLSEYQNMVANGYDRIWDCGNAKYIYEV